MSIDEEQKLVELAKAEPQAFGVLFDAYYQPITNYVLHRVGDLAPAQDITSIVFFKAWHGLPKYEWRSLPFSAWLYRIASNEVNTYFRQKKYRPQSLEALFESTGFEMPSSQDVEGDAVAYQDAVQKHRDFRRIQQCTRELPMKYQEVVSLRFFEKKTLQEISDITGKNLNTTKSLLKRGTEKLRAAFKAQNKSKDS